MKQPLWQYSNAGLAVAGLLGWGAWSAPAQSLFKPDNSRSQFADKRAHGVGDIVTIVVQENTASTKDNSTKTSKEASMDAAISSFLYSPGASGLLTQGGQMPALKYSMKNGFQGGGQINNNEKIAARLAVSVVDVLPNGNLIIEGKKQTKIGGETTDATLRGRIRAADILANNTVFSYNVAEATLHYTSKGPVSDSQRRGWFTKIWDKLTPF